MYPRCDRTETWLVFSLIFFAGDTINIGEVSYKLKKPQNPELVPVKHCKYFSLLELQTQSVTTCKKKDMIWLPLCVASPVSDSLPQTVVQHLRWIMQKDLLGQDVFLIGPPGTLRRSIAMQYLVSAYVSHKHNYWWELLTYKAYIWNITSNKDQLSHIYLFYILLAYQIFFTGDRQMLEVSTSSLLFETRTTFGGYLKVFGQQCFWICPLME